MSTDAATASDQLSFEVTRRDEPTPVRADRRDPREPRLRQDLHRPHGRRDVDRRGGLGRRTGQALRSLPARPGRRRAALRAGDLRGDEGLPPRGRLDLDLPARGQRRPVRPVGPPARPARCCPRTTSSSRCASSSTVDQEWVPAGDAGEKSLYLRPFMFASEAFLGVRPGPAGHLLGHRLAGGCVLLRRAQAGDAVDLDRLCPRRRGRHGRGEVRRQLRQLARRSARGHRARLRPGRLPRLLDAHATSRSSAA